jgi:Flp pilus assembly pilin Flp
MIAYTQLLRSYIVSRLGGHDDGQNMIETSLIIGVISVALVTAFVVSGVQAGITELSRDVACQISNNNAPGVTCP